MKETGSPKLLFENLDLTPIQPTLWTDLHRDGPGRPVEYNPEWDLKALMLRQLHQIPYMKDLVKRLKRNPYLRDACGYREKAPTEAHFSQMKKRIGARAREHSLNKDFFKIWQSSKYEDDAGGILLDAVSKVVGFASGFHPIDERISEE